jgi:hypothetical protein
VFRFLRKKDDLSLQEFIDYYEGKHVPLIFGLAPVPIIYKGEYLAGERLTGEGYEADFDIMTELGSADRQVFDVRLAERGKSGVGQIVANEERFFNRV